jgi:hypothetical protein
LKKGFNKYILKRILPVFFILFSILVGIIKIDMINTKALSPLGNTNENYELVSEEFGEDFSNFIKDNSFLKIYKEPEQDVLVRLGDSDFKISSKSVFIKDIEEMFEKMKF